MPDDGGELWEFTQLIRLEKRFDLTLVVVGLPACRETPRFLGHFALADVFGGNDGGVLIGGGEDEFVAQIEHENVGVAFIECTVNGGIRLRGDHDGGAGLPDDACGAVVGKGGFRTGDDLLAFVSKEDDEIVVRSLLGWLVEAAQGVEVIGEFQNRVDIQPLALKFLWHGDTDDFSCVDFGDGERWLVGAKHFREFWIEKKLQIRAEGALHAAELLGWLVEVAAKRGEEFV